MNAQTYEEIQQRREVLGKLNGEIFVAVITGETIEGTYDFITGVTQ